MIYIRFIKLLSRIISRSFLGYLRLSE